MANGYDISASQSSSDSTTQSAWTKFGAFNNGGGLRIPEYFWPALLAVAGLLAYAWLTRKGR